MSADGRETHVASSKDFSVQLAPELLQGVPLHVCLQRGGRYWKPGRGHGRCVSQTTRRYAYFFSHDWKTSHLAKYFSLLVYFNAVPASIAGLISGCCLGALSVLQVLPHTAWMPLVAHVVVILVLFFWQDIRRITGKQYPAFLDCLCIPQHDDVLKEQCVRGLANFLGKSDKLVVLWSPRYFRRIWCTYEIAFFLKQNQADKIHFVPVQLGALWFLGYFAAILTRTSVFITEMREIHRLPLLEWTLVAGSILLLQQLLVWPAAYHVITGLLKDIAELVKQLRDFQVQEAECFCCSQHHVHPVTRGAIPCDRELIYEALLRWFGPVACIEDGLKAFNLHVRSSLARQVERKSRPVFLILKNGAVAALAACLPHLALDMPNIERVLGLSKPEPNYGRALYMAATQLYTTVAILLGVRVTLLIGDLGLRCLGRCSRRSVLAAQVAAHAFYTFAVLFLWTGSSMVGARYGYFALLIVTLIALLPNSLCFVSRWRGEDQVADGCNQTKDSPGTAAHGCHSFGKILPDLYGASGGQDDDDDSSIFEV